MSWTEQKIQMLKDMWGHGYSASEIAKRLGGLTRNAVIGKAHRLKLSSRPSPIKREDGAGKLPVAADGVMPITRISKKRAMLRPLPPVAMPSTASKPRETFSIDNIKRTEGIAVTKADSGSHVKLLDELVSELEQKRGMAIGHTKFIAMIETADAFARLAEIPLASPRVVAMNIGGEDFALECNMEPSDEALLHPKQHMIIAARAAGVMPLGFIGTVADFSDWEKFRLMVRRSRRVGFDGASCIHPGQVKIVNEEYTPAEDEVAYATKIIAMDEEAAAAGRGSFSFEGKMIDIPVIVRAQKLIRRYEAIKAREAKTLAAT